MKISMETIIARGQWMISELRAEGRDNLEMEVHHVLCAGQWLLECRRLPHLATDCDDGREDWEVYNYAFEILHGRPRTGVARFS